MLDFGYYNMDCMEGMKEFPDNYFDLAIVDPPYGIGINKSGRLGHYGGKGKTWDNNVPDDSYFQELFRVSKEQIVWGGNYFKMPPCKGFIIWDKKQPPKVSFASCEFAWSSFDRVAKTFYKFPVNADEDKRQHPTQKPVDLYVWLLNNYAKQGDKILDTHVGSASSLIACHEMGFDFVGFELDKDYYKQSLKRLDEVRNQMNLFDL